MLFEQRLRDGLASGDITLALRRWRRPQVSTGGVYRTGADGPRVRAVSVEVVQLGDVSDADARDAGFADVAALLAALRGDPTLPLYRIRFVIDQDVDPREVLSAAEGLAAPDVAALDARLDRLDAAPTSPGPWTRATLRLIAERPGVVSSDLAVALGQERQDFKRRVRALKALGLTVSLDVGYRLSPRGRAYLSWPRP